MNDEKLLLYTKVYFLNKSKTKYLIVGVSANDFDPVIRVGSTTSKHCVDLSNTEWLDLINNIEIVMNVLNGYGSNPTNINLKTISLYIEEINGGKFLKMVKEKKETIILGKQSLEILWNLENLIKCQIVLLSSMGLKEYYKTILHKTLGEVNAIEYMKCLLDQQADNLMSFCIKELIHFSPNSVLHDINELKNQFNIK